MNVEIKLKCKHTDWGKIPEILKSVGMAYHSPEIHKKAFDASYCTVFAYDHENLVGFGRAISDGLYQAAVYDLAVIEECQGHWLGKRILQAMLSKMPDCNIILYASPGKEDFYEKQGFRKMKTGMALFTNREGMAERGFTE